MVPWNKSGVILLTGDHAEMTESSMVTLYLALQSMIPEDMLSDNTPPNRPVFSSYLKLEDIHSFLQF